MHHGMGNSALPTGKKKTRFEKRKEGAFLKTSTRREGALYLVFFCNGLDKPSSQAARAASSLLSKTIGLKSSTNNYYDVLKVVNGKAEYLCMISKSNAREWWGSVPLAL